jgi:hypothetical protein
MIDKAKLEAMLWRRIRRHIPEQVIQEAGEPTITWQPALIGEAPVFTFADPDGNGDDTEVTFAPDDAVLVRFRLNGYVRLDAFKHGQRGVVADWMREDSELN